MANDMSILNYLEAGINAEGARQRAIANNVANVNSPNYRRNDVRFEELLAKAIKGNGEVDKASLEAELYNPKTTPISANGNDVALDMEIGEMVKNSLRHKAYLLLLKKKYRQLNDAMRTV
jgi:flagellar basal-body rod protein FlgB